MIGEGDGARKRAVFQADGALEQKLATYEKIMTVAYTEMAKQKWVPEWVMDGSGNGNASNGGSQMNTFMNMMNANAMQQLGLNMNNISGGSGAPAGPVKKKK